MSTTSHFLTLPEHTEQIRERLRQVRCFVLDMDGTIYLSNRIFPYTIPFLKKLEATGRSYCFFTNNSSKNKQDYVDKLTGMGIDLVPEQVFLSTQVILEEMERLHSRDSFFIVGTPNLENAFRGAGLKVINGSAGTEAPAADYESAGQEADVDNKTSGLPVVILGFDTGKPSRHALKHIIRHTGFKEEELAFVGDRIYTDIAIANGTKALSIMVLTGETQMEDLEQYDFRPDVILPSLEELSGLL